MAISLNSHIRSKAEFIAHLNPKAWELVGGGPFIFSDAHVELMVADAVKSVASAIADKALSREVMGISKTMAQEASGSLLASWEPGDELCPPWRWPWPFPHSWSGSEKFGPHPDPWEPVRAAEQIELAHTLTWLSGLTTSKEFNTALKGAATKLAGIASATMLEEFERCGTVPRPPFPPRR